jgi:hypothetical protein
MTNPREQACKFVFAGAAPLICGALKAELNKTLKAGQKFDLWMPPGLAQTDPEIRAQKASHYWRAG